MNYVRSLVLSVLSRLFPAGSVELALPGGTVATVGQGAPEADLLIEDYSVIPEMLRTGLIGFSEAYMDRRVQSSDLRRLFEWAGANKEIWLEHSAARATARLRRFWQRIRPESRHPRVRSMNDHYNLGNDFYEAWLDETMTYSSARFSNPDQPLEQAQKNKYRAIARHLQLKPGMKVLEIGCGWGGFAEFAAGELGCTVVGITLSVEQGAYAQKRMAEAGLADRVDIRIQDYRDVEGEFDAIVSIEMIESVDETQWPPLFDVMAARVKKGGRIGMQVITIENSEWELYRSRADFIQQYIFPGGQLPAPKILSGLANDAGLGVEQVETFGLDYARTLATWRQRFEKAWPELRIRHALDDRFHRMWDLYLTLCEAGFRMGRINVEQWVFSR